MIIKKIKACFRFMALLIIDALAEVLAEYF